jgi:hypothetical protein
MKQFHSIEKCDVGMFSWLFSRPQTSTCYPFIVGLRTDAQAFQQVGVVVRQARQGSCGWWCEKETVFYSVITMRHHQMVIVTEFSAYSAEGLFEWDLLLDLWWWKEEYL